MYYFIEEIKSENQTDLNLRVLKKIFSLMLGCLIIHTSFGQTIKPLLTECKTSLRGLSVVTNKVIWASGSNGTVGHSFDGGNQWKWFTVKGFEKTEFRDIEGFDETSAVIMGVGEPAYILRTADGGEHWKVVFEDNTKGMFLDAMEFWNENSGIVIGDPINGKIFVARTFDGGFHWRTLPFENLPVADSGEAMFASSGTNIRKISLDEAVFVSGGLSSHLFIRDQKIKLPLLQGTESTGANSIAVKNKNYMIAVGGDFMKKDSTEKNCVIIQKGNLFTTPAVPPHGYRSCVEYLGKSNWVTCGLNGADISNDDGNTWQIISTTDYHVCRKAKKGNAVFFAGGNGRIGKLIK